MMLVVAFAQLFCLSTAHMLLITARVISQARKENVSFFTLRCGTTRAEHKIVFMKCNCPVECKQKKNSTATRLQAHMLTQMRFATALRLQDGVRGVERGDSVFVAESF